MLPAGVKFDPTDQELIEHLEAKVSADSARFQSHRFVHTDHRQRARHIYATPNLRNFQVRHGSAVYLHKHIPLFVALFFFLDADLVKQLQFDI